MPQLNHIEIKQKRAAALKRADELHKTAAAETRDLTAAERRDFDRALAEAQQCAGQLERDAEIRAALGHAGRGGDGMASGDTGDAEMRAWFANEFRDMASGSSFGGGLVPLDYQSRIWDRLVPMAVALKTGPTIIETNSKTISLPHLTADAAAAWTGEAGTISETDPTGETRTVTPQKIAALTKVSREFADDSNPKVVDLLLQNLQRSIALGVDLAFYNGTGSSNQPTGLKNTSGITTQSMGANGAAPTNLDFLLTAITSVYANNGDSSSTVIVMNAHVWGELLALKDSQNRYLLSSVQNGDAPQHAIDGVPVYVTNQLPQTETQGTSNVASSVYVYDAKQVIVVRRQDMRLETTNDAFFTTDQIGIRAISRVAFDVPNPLAVVRIAGVL
jgi:HK97 family phage major capsid protein